MKELITENIMFISEMHEFDEETNKYKVSHTFVGDSQDGEPEEALNTTYHCLIKYRGYLEKQLAICTSLINNKSYCIDVDKEPMSEDDMVNILKAIAMGYDLDEEENFDSDYIDVEGLDDFE